MSKQEPASKRSLETVEPIGKRVLIRKDDDLIPMRCIAGIEQEAEIIFTVFFILRGSSGSSA